RGGDAERLTVVARCGETPHSIIEPRPGTLVTAATVIGWRTCRALQRCAASVGYCSSDTARSSVTPRTCERPGLLADALPHSQAARPRLLLRVPFGGKAGPAPDRKRRAHPGIALDGPGRARARVASGGVPAVPEPVLDG